MADSWGLKSVIRGLPKVVRIPWVAITSFKVYGMPCKGPRYLPLMISFSACWAR